MNTAKIPVSVMIFTLNEAIHLPTCLQSLTEFDDVIVVDSYSTDDTQTICQDNKVRFYQNTFEGFGSQRNWAFDNIDIKYSWVLILDADERVTPTLASEISQVIVNVKQDTAAFQLKRQFYMWGRWLKYSSLYPSWVVRLVHKEKVRYINRGHAETQDVQGQIEKLNNDLIDENLKGIDEWFERQNRYSSQEAEYEYQQNGSKVKLWKIFSRDALQRREILKALAARVPGRMIVYFIYTYIVRLGFLDGKAGFVFCVMKALYQSMIAVKKYDIRQRIDKT